MSDIFGSMSNKVTLTHSVIRSLQIRLTQHCFWIVNLLKTFVNLVRRFFAISSSFNFNSLLLQYVYIINVGRSVLQIDHIIQRG